MSFPLDKEIKITLGNFIRKYGIKISDEEKQTFLEDDKKRKGELYILDIFLHICDFLNIDEILNFTYTCKYYTNFEKYIWSNLLYYKKMFSHSLLNNDDNVNIKKNLALEKYYYNLNINNDIFNNLFENEKNHLKCLKEIKKIKFDYNYQNITYKKEIKTYEKEIKEEYEKLCDCGKSFLDLYKFISINNYLTIKKEIDMEFYGFDSKKKEDVDYWENHGKKWAYYEINDIPIEISEEEYNSENKENYFEYFTENDEYTNEIFYYKKYIKPTWFLK